MTILSEWNSSGLSEEPLYSEMFADIKKRADIEQMYGPGMNSDNVTDYIKKLTEKFNA